MLIDSSIHRSIQASSLVRVRVRSSFFIMVMAVFAYIYHQSFVASQSLSVEMILDQTWQGGRTLWALGGFNKLKGTRFYEFVALPVREPRSVK
ncbi:Phosphatidate cytidylyltransferase 1 [Camellia lanceoleosa]|uniref:Phosphatidate cytidylyltransferase 1 n=1 Tax=Camellia lanceoleosa TaxID=1840588 RepID=A0ACC0J2I8_9ERIC|nr:Phosphatidate cytidylyltransferase 1 [Camellia lanceoleosa]